MGNTTFEIVALYEGDSTLNQPAKFNRIIFGTDDITALSNSIKNEFQHPVPTNFNIVSGGEEVTMGIQTNLDSLSESSNFYVSFWEYLNTGLSFPDRTVNAASVEELYQKLGSRLATNPLGIIELKEIHLSLSADITDQWHQLLGPSENNTWNLAKGPVISYDMSPVNKGIDWISIKVADLDDAMKHLPYGKLLSNKNGKLSIIRFEDFGLKIFLEE